MWGWGLRTDRVHVNLPLPALHCQSFLIIIIIIIIVQTALYGAEAWGMISPQRRKINVLLMKCLRSLVGVPRMDKVTIKEVRRRPGIERELGSRADH